MLTQYSDKRTFDNPGSPPVSSLSFTNGSHPVELYINGDKSVRTDVLFNHVHVIGFLYIQDGIITKAFLPKRTPAEFTDEVREIFGPMTKAAE